MCSGTLRGDTETIFWPTVNMSHVCQNSDSTTFARRRISDERFTFCAPWAFFVCFVSKTQTFDTFRDVFFFRKIRRPFGRLLRSRCIKTLTFDGFHDFLCFCFSLAVAFSARRFTSCVLAPSEKGQARYLADGRHFLCRRSSTNIICTTVHVLCIGILPAPFSAQRFMLRVAPY